MHVEINPNKTVTVRMGTIEFETDDLCLTQAGFDCAVPEDVRDKIFQEHEAEYAVYEIEDKGVTYGVYGTGFMDRVNGRLCVGFRAKYPGSPL